MALTRAASGRLVQALLDLFEQSRLSTARFLQADQDRSQRLVAIEQLSASLDEAEADRAARLAIIEGARLRLVAAEEELTRLRNRVAELEQRHAPSTGAT